MSRGRGRSPLGAWSCGVWCGCGSRGSPGVRGVRDVRSCSYSGAGPRPLFVAPPPSKVERAHPGAGAQATNRGVVGASRECSDRLANRNGLSGECQCQLARVGESLAGGWCGCRFGAGGGAGRDLPAVGSELARDRDRDDPVGFAARVSELPPARVQAALCLPGDVDDLGRVAALATLERLADDRAATGRGTTSARCPCGSFSDAALPNPA